MSSVCGRLDVESHLESSSASTPSKCSNGSKNVSCIVSEDALESDGDDSGYTPQNVSEESKDKAINKTSSESLDDAGDDDKSLGIALQDTVSENMSEVKVIPAIKGSREKHGKSVQKLSVSWAEDVYDPPPSIVSHTRSKKQQPQKSKSKDNLRKSGKKGQKGSSNSSSSSSRGSKEKKKVSSRSFKYNRDNIEWATTTQMPIVASSS